MKSKVLIMLILALAGFGIGFSCIWLLDNKIPNFREETDLYVYPDTTPSEIEEQLAGSVKRPRSLSRTFRKKQVAEFITPGHYVVRPSHSSVYVARMLNNGWQTPVKLTLSGSLRLRDQIAKKISSQMMVDSATVRAALDDKELLAEFGFTPENVFALFVPDSYEHYWTDSMRTIFARQKKAYDAFWNPDRIAKARALKFSKMQVSILASIVRQESYHEEEYPSVASVYINRIRKGMRLQACPTVMFLYDYTLDRLLFSQIKAKKDSPYNTYMHDGLPPAPICVPTKAALDAVLNPAKEPYLYFCADASFNGYNVFAKTFAEHNKNAKAYQKAFTERKKAKAAAGK